MSEPRGRLVTHRAMALWRYRCYADPRFFGPEAQMPATLQEERAQQGGLPCTDGQAGMVGWWCADCRFGQSEELYTTWAR